MGLICRNEMSVPDQTSYRAYPELSLQLLQQISPGVFSSSVSRLALVQTGILALDSSLVHREALISAPQVSIQSSPKHVTKTKLSLGRTHIPSLHLLCLPYWTSNKKGDRKQDQKLAWKFWSKVCSTLLSLFYWLFWTLEVIFSYLI